MGELLPLSVFERITGEFLPLSAPQGGCAPDIGELPISEPLPRRNSPAMTCKNEVPSCWTVAEDLCWLILKSLSKISACMLLCVVCLCVFIVSDDCLCLFMVSDDCLCVFIVSDDGLCVFIVSDDCLWVFIVSRHSQARTHIHSYLRAFG